MRQEKHFLFSTEGIQTKESTSHPGTTCTTCCQLVLFHLHWINSPKKTTPPPWSSLMAFTQSTRALSTSVPPRSTATQEAPSALVWRLAGGVGAIFPVHQVRAAAVYWRLSLLSETLLSKRIKQQIGMFYFQGRLCNIQQNIVESLLNSTHFFIATKP